MWILQGLLVLAIICYSKAAFGDLVIHTDLGSVEGWERVSRDGRVYQAWTAIPYAEPPLGPLRFQPPKPKSGWSGVLNATGDAPMCWQIGRGTSRIVGSEDCLFLNVYRPKINKENMPVLVYVHGGAFQNGHMGPREIADYLMDEDVVLVTIQYRLNAIGFMSLADSVMPGNFGLKDQVQALKWVNRNIAEFGGNPSSVTVFGESAGAASTHILLKTPATDGLVHRAVSDSGTINRLWSEIKPEFIRNHTLKVANGVGCHSTDSHEVLKCLQNADASDILTKLMEYDIEPTVQLFMPVLEPADAVDPIATFDLSLRPTKKPWITSTTSGEWLLFRLMMGNKEYPGKMRDYLEQYLPLLPIDLTKAQVLGAAEILEKFYFPDENTSVSRVEQVTKMEADFTFLYPIMANIKLHQGPKWIHRYEYVDEISQVYIDQLNSTEEVAFHASPMFTYLNIRSTIPQLGPVERPQDYEVSKRLIKYLVNFAYFDDPTPGPTPFKWKQFKETEILRVTKLGDFYADKKTLQGMYDVYYLWDTIIGWKNKLLP